MTDMTRSPARPTSRRRRGFTLTEVLLVLAILGVIAAMVVPNLIGNQKVAYEKATKVTIKAVEEACTQYAIAHDGEYPADLGLLTAPGADKDGKAISPYLTKPPLDAWNQQLHYELNGASKSPTLQGPAIWSSGANKVNDDGSQDDISNWK